MLGELAAHTGGEYVPMRDIAEKLGISHKYLEQIVPVLSKSGIIEGLQGKGGGYRLLRDPKECKVGEVLRLTEGDLAPVACLSCGAEPCVKECRCTTHPMWVEFYQMINDFFDSKTLADLVETENNI